MDTVWVSRRAPDRASRSVRAAEAHEPPRITEADEPSVTALSRHSAAAEVEDPGVRGVVLIALLTQLQARQIAYAGMTDHRPRHDCASPVAA